MTTNNNCIIILIIFIFSVIYAYPNIYGEDPVIIIKKTNITTNFSINTELTKLNIHAKKITQKDLTTILRFHSTEEQFNAFEKLKNLKNENIDISQNIIPSEKIKYLELIKAYPMKLGLDLRGGVHIVSKINISNEINKKLKTEIFILKKALKENNLKYKTIKIKNKTIKIIFFSNDVKNKCTNLIKNISQDIIAIENTNSILIKLTKKAKISIKNNIINKTLSVLTNRVNELGISETVIQRYGDNKITIDMPGIQNIEYAKNMIGKTATLKFMLVETNSKKKNSKIFYDKNNNKFLLKNKNILTGESIIYATSGFENNLNKPCVNLKIDKKSAESFKKITKKNIGKPMAIVYKEMLKKDNKLEKKEYIISLAKIMSPLDEQFQITGFNMQESKDLAILLRSGSLPATISIIEEKIIGPSLGENNITNSIKSLIISLISIMLFMTIRYKKLGIIANIALLTNITLLIAIMSIIGITMTLSGIAGIILTIGMSIDSNILIFERIKEEFKITSNVNIIIEDGFKNAMSSIIDANMTTLLMSLILFIVAAGPVKGFAIALSIGIITSIYSSIFVTKNMIKFITKKYISICQ